MNGKEFFEKVAAMRYHQKRYFATRAADALKMSKDLEKTIDDEIDRVNKILAARNAGKK